MILSGKRRSKFIAETISTICLGLYYALGFLQNPTELFDTQPADDLIHHIYAAAYSHRTAVYWVVAPLGLLSYIASRFIPDPFKTRLLNQRLDEFRDTFFKGRDAGNVSAHKVTLYKYAGWRFYRCDRWWQIGFDKRLIAVARSGHLKRNFIPSFSVSDNVKCRPGFAGTAFRSRQPIASENLPNLFPHGRKDNKPEKIESYANQTSTLPAFVKRRLRKATTMARSFLGTVVYVNNEPWGVIVIDSTLQKMTDIDDYKSKVKQLASDVSKTVGV